jgi:hypothetical protein
MDQITKRFNLNDAAVDSAMGIYIWAMLIDSSL